MEFYLLYQGELLPSGNRNTRPDEKHKIRRELHPQLRRQWQVNAALRQLAAYRGSQYDPAIRKLEKEQERFDRGIASIGKHKSRFGYEFVPLVTADQAPRVLIDVLLLRPEGKAFIYKQGDIDGQVKTIFDALTLPTSREQVDATGPKDDETPFFCLLEDDRMISEVRVNADQLLLLPHERAVKANDAFAVIRVQLNARTPGAIGNFF